jgi:hypothetical protein
MAWSPQFFSNHPEPLVPSFSLAAVSDHLAVDHNRFPRAALLAAAVRSAITSLASPPEK